MLYSRGTQLVLAKVQVQEMRKVVGPGKGLHRSLNTKTKTKKFFAAFWDGFISRIQLKNEKRPSPQVGEGLCAPHASDDEFPPKKV